MVSLFPLSVTYLFISGRLGGAVWAAILIHFAGNAAGALLPQTSDLGALLQFAVTVVIAATVYGIWLRNPGPRATAAIATTGADA